MILTKEDILSFLGLHQSIPAQVNQEAKIIGPFGLQFPLINRESTIKFLQDQIQNHLLDSSTDRKFHPIPVLAGCPGIGKSRILQELPKILKDTSNYKEIISILITYQNGNGPTDYDRKYPVAAFCWRMLHYYFFGAGEPKIRQFLSNLPNGWSQLSPNRTFQIISEDYRKMKFLDNSCQILFYVGLDEFQLLVQDTSPNPYLTPESKAITSEKSLLDIS